MAFPLFTPPSRFLDRTWASLSPIRLRLVWMPFLLIFSVSCAKESSGDIARKGITKNEESRSEDESWKLVFDPPSAPEGRVARWIPVAENGSDAAFNVVAGGVEGSDQSLVTTMVTYGDGSRWDVQIYQEAVPIEADKIYEYSVWVKGESGSRVNVGVESIDYSSIKNKDVYLTGEWQVVAFEFLSPYNEIRTPIHFGFPQNVDRAIQVDQVRLELAE